jgi:hypothetical protein
MFHRYQYEAEYYPTLSHLPLDLRRKLDLAGIRLGLKDWQAISFEERMVLCHLACDTDEETRVFTNFLDFLSRKYCGKPIERIAAVDSALWDSSAVPHAVREKSAAVKREVNLDQWCSWQPHERYALYKTAVSSRQPEAFEQVLSQLSR